MYYKNGKAIFFLAFYARKNLNYWSYILLIDKKETYYSVLLKIFIEDKGHHFPWALFLSLFFSCIHIWDEILLRWQNSFIWMRTHHIRYCFILSKITCHGHWFGIEKLLSDKTEFFSCHFRCCLYIVAKCIFFHSNATVRLKFNSKMLQCCWMFSNFMHRVCVRVRSIYRSNPERS